MSSITNQKQSSWKVVEAQLRSTLMEISAERVTVLGAEDASTWARTLVLSCLSLQDLLSDGSRLRSDGSLKQWCNAIAKGDILEVAKGLKEFQSFLRTYPDEWAFLSYGDFKHRFPYRFTGDFWSPVKDILLSFLANPVPATFVVLNQWVSFPLKLTLQGLAGDLTQKAEQDYLDNEVRLSKLLLPTQDVEDMSVVLGEWFASFNYNADFEPHHSNGAVSNRDTKLGLYGKYLHMSTDCRINLLYGKFGVNLADVGFTKTSKEMPQAALITVPKGIDKRRSICPEPAEYQFNQQGVWDLLDRYIRRNPIGDHIAIHDQSVNREAALLASRECNAATIDLSSASDSVSWRLVKKVFRRCLPLLVMMQTTRSKTVKLPSGRVIATNKYAPMGSALCFPIESVLFAAMCEVAGRRNGYRGRGFSYHVYGDDIIVSANIFQEVLAILNRCGFLVNELKTFDPYCRYKESCGIEGLDGVDVSCLGISRKFSAGPIDRYHPELVAGYVAFANALYLRGFSSARVFLLACLCELPIKYRPPFSGNERVGILSSTPTNYRQKRRWNESLFEWEIQVGVMTSIRIEQDVSGSNDPDCEASRITSRWCVDELQPSFAEIRYLETLRRYSVTKRSGVLIPEDLIQVDIRKPSRQLRSRWLPEWWFQSTTTGFTLTVGGDFQLVAFYECDGLEMDGELN